MQSGVPDPSYSPVVPSGFDMVSATLADLDALVELEKKCFLGDQISRRSFRRWLSDTQDILLLVKQGAHLAGYILILCHRGTRLARIYSLAVDPECRGKDRKSTRLNSSHVRISYAVFCLKKKKKNAQNN